MDRASQGGQGNETNLLSIAKKWQNRNLTEVFESIRCNWNLHFVVLYISDVMFGVAPIHEEGERVIEKHMIL